MTPLISATGSITLDKEVYGLDEIVKIKLENTSQNYSLSIVSEENIFKYSGELENELEFYAREPGNYITRLIDDNNNLIDEKEFSVLKYHLVESTGVVYTDKQEYMVNEPVLIYINTTETNVSEHSTGLNATGEFELAIISETEIFKYLDVINSPLPFIPQEAGMYKVELRKDFKPIAQTEFSVIDQQPGYEPEQKIELVPENITTNITINTTENLTLTEKKETGIIIEEIPKQEATEEEIEGEEDETEPRLPFKLNLKNKQGIKQEISFNVIQETAQEYDLEVFPNKASIRKIEFNKLKIKTIGDENFDLDEVSIKQNEIRADFKGKKIINSFFIDTSGLNYANGTITSIAAGEELWKCRDWNKIQEICTGSWIKVMDLTPGQEYEIKINPEDPAYAETGVASINTKKSIYHTGETAEIIIVVLDIKGHLVSNANVDLIITAPDNQVNTFSTSQGTITETSRGIYETSYSNTMLEGSYDLFVSAKAPKVDSLMQSNFEVKKFYEFDILRNTPVTTDPWQGPFTSSINLVSYVNESDVSTFDFTEIIPSNFLVVDAGGANTRTSGNKTFLTWTNLINNSIVKYIAQPPLVTPDLYALGKSFVSYIGGLQGVLKIFTEARFWYLAIDPLIDIFFEDFESGWGCQQTTTPSSGQDCSNTPWGDFTNCSDNGGDYVFCTTDDGQEGSHITYAIQMVDWDTWDNTQGIWYEFNPSVYDDVNVNGYMAAASLDNANEFCRIWARDSDSWATIYQCVNNVPAGCEAGDRTPEAADYRYFDVNLSTLSNINLSESVLAVHIGADQSGFIDFCFWDRINITGIANPPTVTLLDPGNDTTATSLPIDFNFTVTDSVDSLMPNCTLWGDFTGSWAPNKSITNVNNNTETNITINLPDSTYIWNVKCQDNANLTDDYTYNYTITVDAQPPIKTVNRVSEDTSAPWNTTDRTPYVNLSLNKNGDCRMSLSDENYSAMSDDYDCTGDGTQSINCSYTGPELSIGDHTVYIACNDTSGHEDNTTTNLNLAVDIVCDAHSDCDTTDYCNFQQNCALDILPGYGCDTPTFDGNPAHEVCGDGTNKYCVNDSTYSYTGWYCTGDTNDCVYNNQGFSYDLGETLCESGSNDYRNCSTSNEWDSLFDCAEQYDAYNQSATYHPGEYCAYYLTAQTCVNGTSGGCSGSSTDCNPHIYNQTTQECGSILVDCDLGCGAGCDPSNSTTPGIISSTCYYDKTCSDACAWSQNNEEAPEYCINDNDGGACAYENRTNPTTAETCYWNVTCTDGSGATLNNGTANNLRADYCDYCNASGNQTGSYAPIPNASCSSGCANSGTIYYDNGGTPGDRSDDCSNGTSTILSDTLATGDVWNGSAPAVCNDTECEADCGSLDGSCAGEVCECTDNDYPILIILSPDPDSWDNDGSITFQYNVTDVSSGIENCSLVINGSINMTNSSINESVSTQSFVQSFVNGTYNWSIRCYDNSSNYNMNESSSRIIGEDTTDPVLSNPNRDGTEFDINDYVCLNITITDTVSGVHTVWAEIDRPGANPDENITLYDNQTTSCDGTNGDNVYSIEYQLVFSGTYNWTTAYANDSANNQNSLVVGLSWNVSAAGNLSIEMLSPLADLEINESESNNNFTMTCNATCEPGPENCTYVYLFAQYEPSTFQDITTSTTDLVNDEDNFSCGNMTQGGAPCTHTFNITSGSNSGNNTWPIRCKANSENSPTTFSDPVNLTINDHPYPNITYPENNTWVTGKININASSSFDSDGSITNYLFEYDNNTAFSSPGTLCNGANSNCTWNTSQDQSQCENNSMSCYLRVTETDDDGLTNSTYILLGFDTQGPTATLDRPPDFENITTNTFDVNATATDSESGVDTVFFEYRQNASDTWKAACNDSDGSAPYNCSWNTTALPDGNKYQFRAYANDSLGNTGNYDTHINITIDRTAPVINLENPVNDDYTANTTIIFYYNVTDSTSDISNCSLILNGTVMNTTLNPAKDTTLNFTRTLNEGTYNWSVNCTDRHGYKNNSETRNITIDITGPTATLDRPPDFENISRTLSYTVNASASDPGINNVSVVTFEYRKGASGGWTLIGTDNREPVYNYDWDLTGLSDGNDYQVRVWANDTLGNNGSADAHTDITIDNNPPNITLISPPNEDTDGDGNVIFKYSVNDTAAGILNCSLIFDGSINQTNSSVSEGEQQQFELTNLTNGNYNWTINCTDSFGQVGTATNGPRNITIDIRYDMNVNVSTDNNTYETGNQEGEDANISTNITDYYNNSLPDVNVTNDIVKVYNLSEQVAPWWNTSWERRKPVFVSSDSALNLTNITIILNVTGLDGNITSCVNEIRVASVYNEESNVNILSGDDSTYCEIAFKGDVSAGASNENNYFVYYNNSGASDPGYPTITNFTYSIFFENFDGSGWTTITGEDPLTGCSGGYGTNFNNCDDNSADYSFAQTSGGVAVSDGYMYVQEDWDAWAANRGIWYSFDALAACGGTACDDITVKGQVATGSVDNSNEYCRVWARNSTGTSYVLLYNCVGADPACEFSDGNSDIPNASQGHFESFDQNISEDLGLGLSTYIAVHIGGQTPGPHDQCFFEDLNISGYKKQYPNITSTSVGSPQELIARNTSTTNNDGIWSYLYDVFNHTLGNYSTVSFGQKDLYTDTYDYEFFEIIQDQTGPNVTLQGPPNGSEANSSVTFSYVVNDTLSSILNCTLIIDGEIDDNRSDIQEGPTQFFYPRIPLGGWHNWSVNCTDYYGNEGASPTWEIFIKPPDLIVRSTNISFNNTSPGEGENITINATIFNIGGSDAINVTIQFWLGDPDSGGTQINDNFTTNITDINGDKSNVTFNVSWIVTGPGPFDFYVVADPPTATNGSIAESNESNNKAFNTLNVPAYNYFHGEVESNIYLSNIDDESLYYYLNIANTTGNILATDEGSSIGFGSLQAISRDVNNNSVSNDFNDTDTGLNMTDYNDSIRAVYTHDTDTPIETKSISVYGRQINNIPIINSTNTTYFQTGILWDMSDGHNEYNGTQDLLFITEINQDRTGKYGTYDYEIRVPVNLKNYVAEGSNIDFYWEIIDIYN